MASTQAVFFLNPQNRAYVQKQIRRPLFQEMSAAGLWGLFAVFAVVAVLFASYAIPAWRSYFSLTNAGASIQGQVDDLGFENRDVSYFYVLYNYTINGVRYQREQRVDFDQYNLVLDTMGSGIPVRYAVNDPALARLDAPFEDFGDLRGPISYFGGGFLIIMLIALLIHANRRMSNSELVAKGKLVKGTIVAAYGNQPERDGTAMQIVTLLFGWAWYLMRRQRQSEFRVKVRYSFVSPVSQKEVSKTETVVRNDLDRRSVPVEGTLVAVLYRSDHHFRLL